MSKLRLLVVAGLCAGMALSAGATTYVRMSDDHLADSAPLIAQVKILARESGLGPFTDYQAQVLNDIKGFLPGSTLVVRVPGGITSDGVGLWIPGVPEFEVNEEALVFLSPRSDGTYTLFHLGLGAFHRVEARGHELAVRSLDGAVVLETDGSPAEDEQVRDFARFSQWLTDRAKGEIRDRDYLLSLKDGGLDSLHDFFTLFEAAGLNLRWPDFDSGGNVTFFAHEDGQTGMTGGGFNEFQAAMQAWNNDPATNINLVYGGTSTATGGLTNFDNVNALQFDDPNGNQLFGGPFSCTQGGVLAVGGPWFDSTTPITNNFNGKTFLSILGADIITNQESQCFLNGHGRKDAEEVFGHELGHTLGLRHSCGANDPAGPCNTTNWTVALARGRTKSDALMRANAHGDGRGAAIRRDDRAGIVFLYRSVSIGSGSAGQVAPCVPSNTTLCLNNDRFQVDVNWRSPSSNGLGFNVKLTPDTGYFWFFNPENVEMVIKVLNGCSITDHFWVFAGGLTNVEVDITVTDTDTGALRSYHNPLNTPFQPIQDTSAFATCP